MPAGRPLMRRPGITSRHRRQNRMGQARIEHIDAGNCQITFDLDKDAWEEA